PLRRLVDGEAQEPLQKVTIIPRGRALGITMFLPERDKYSQSKVEIKAMLASLFGGRIAEELIFGADKVTTGAADDIRRATGLARRMVPNSASVRNWGRCVTRKTRRRSFSATRSLSARTSPRRQPK